MKYREESPEVFYISPHSPVFGPKEREFLIEKAQENPRKRSRLCFHQQVDSKFHEMIILHYQDAYVRPHYHLGKSESIHIIEGKLDLILFSLEGRIRKVFSLSKKSPDFTYCRVQQEEIHMLVIRSEFAIFHESTQGPFNPDHTKFPDWAPLESSTTEVQHFLNDLDQEISAELNKKEIELR